MNSRLMPLGSPNCCLVGNSKDSRMERLISLLGLFVMLGLAGLMSSNRRHIKPRIVVGGVLLQVVFAVLILKTVPGRWLFDRLGDFFSNVQKFSDVGASFVFGTEFRQHFIAFSILPTIIFFSAFMSVLYYLGVMQFVVRAMSFVMQWTLGISGAESLSTAANIFVGQTEAPLIIKPYVERLTMSELMTVMVGGFATIAGGVMAAYIGFGIDAGHLMTASVISAPAALVIAKILVPETETPETAGVAVREMPQVGVNVVEAATIGASDGLHLALNVGAMLIAFMALVAMLDATIQWGAGCCGYQTTLGEIIGLVFSPFAWLMGVPKADCLRVGELLGLRMVANEFVAYEKMHEWMKPGSGVVLAARSKMILTYALCGCANFASIGIQIGGIGGMVPSRRADLAKLGVKAMLGGTLATFMTACVVGALIDE